MVGTEIGNYRILEKIGEGGMGAVYKAVDINLDRIVAIKALNTELSGNPELEERFRTEIKALGNLNHPNLATLHTVFIENGRAWMVMEFIEGDTLDQIVRRRGPVPSEEAIPLFRQALSGVGYAHRMGIVHRDIKPGNIMLTRQGVVKVMDFGIAKALSVRGVAKSGTRMGTTFYMSPEQFLNRGVDFRSDIYSLGVTLYQMLTGRVPFSANTDYQIMSDHLNVPPPALSSIVPSVPQKVENPVLKALAKNPDGRYQSVEEFGAALDNSQGMVAAAPAISAAPVAAMQVVAAVPSAGLVAAGAAAVPSKPALSALFATRQRKIVAGGVATLALAGILLALLPGARRLFSRNTAAAQTAATDANATPNAPPPPPPLPPLPDSNAVPAQPGAPVDGVAVVPVQPVAPAAAPAGPLVIPAGTVVAVRLSDPVDSSMNQVGDKFAASVDEAVRVKGTEAIPAGADATVALTSLALAPVAVQTDVQLQLVSLNINGADYTPRSSVFEQEGVARSKKNTAKIIGGAAVGAAIGGIFGHGAAKGAAAGAAKTFVVLIPAQTRIKFTLRRSITLPQ